MLKSPSLNFDAPAAHTAFVHTIILSQCCFFNTTKISHFAAFALRTQHMGLLRKVFKSVLGLNLCGYPAQGSLSVKFDLEFLCVCVCISKRKREEDEARRR